MDETLWRSAMCHEIEEHDATRKKLAIAMSALKRIVDVAHRGNRCLCSGIARGALEKS